MLSGLKHRMASVGTIGDLCRKAEKLALADGQREPGAEHFLLAALELPDGTAGAAFAALGADAEQLRQAIAEQHASALRSIGVASSQGAPAADEGPQLGRNRLYSASPSGQAVVQELASARPKNRRLLGSDVVTVVAGMPHGTAARALRHMGLDPVSLTVAAQRAADEAR